jgi:hypothetical protein
VVERYCKSRPSEAGKVVAGLLLSHADRSQARAEVQR